MDDTDSDDCGSIPYLYCVQCSHDLNHPLYLVQSHPVVSSLLLCILCYEEVNNRLQQVIPSCSSLSTADVDSCKNGDMNSSLNARSEICNICFDGGDLYLCGDEQSCNRAYCHDCIVSLFGSNELHRIDQLPYWKCYSCDGDQGVTSFFKDAFAYAEQQSMYNQKVNDGRGARTAGGGDKRRAENVVGLLSEQIVSNDEKVEEEEEEEEDEMEAVRELSILKAIVESCDEALVSIERDAIQEKEREVREELFQRQQSIDPASRYSITSNS